MARWLLVLLLLLPMIPDALAKQRPVGGYRTERRLVVRVYMDYGRLSIVTPIIDAFNAKSPPRVPELMLEFRAFAWCEDITPERGIVPICYSRDVHPSEADAQYAQRGRKITGGMIRFGRELPMSGQTICHEMMHVLAGAPHNGFKRDATSCVAGLLLGEPGAWDVKFLKRAYKRNHR